MSQADYFNSEFQFAGASELSGMQKEKDQKYCSVEFAQKNLFWQKS